MARVKADARVDTGWEAEKKPPQRRWPSGKTAKRYQPSGQVFTRRLDSVSLQGGSSAHCWHTRAEALVCDLPCRSAGCCPHVCLARSSQCLCRSRCASTCSAVCCSFCAQNLMAAWLSVLIATDTSLRALSAPTAARVRLSASSLPTALLFLLAKEHCLCLMSFLAGISKCSQGQRSTRCCPSRSGPSLAILSRSLRKQLAQRC